MLIFEQKISTDKLNVPRAYKYQKLSKNRWSKKNKLHEFRSKLFIALS